MTNDLRDLLDQYLDATAESVNADCCGLPILIANYKDNIWECESCGHRRAFGRQEPVQTNDPFYQTPKVKSGCECGAQHTRNTNMHSHWCPKAGAK